MSSVPFQALKTNSLIAFDLFELVVAGLLKIVGFAQTIGLSFPNASLSLAKISGSFHTIILSITFRAHHFVPIEKKRSAFGWLYAHPVAEAQLPLLRLVSRRFRDHPP